MPFSFVIDINKVYARLLYFHNNCNFFNHICTTEKLLFCVMTFQTLIFALYGAQCQPDRHNKHKKKILLTSPTGVHQNRCVFNMYKMRLLETRGKDASKRTCVPSMEMKFEQSLRHLRYMIGSIASYV